MAQGQETEAHTLYNLGLLGFDEIIWMEGITSDSYIVRASVAPVYARRLGPAAIPKLLQMDREASHELEKVLILSALVVAGHTSIKEEFLAAVYKINNDTCFRMLRITWKREIVFALHLVEKAHFEIWEKMAGVKMQQLLHEITEIENSLKEQKEIVMNHNASVAPPVKIVQSDKEIFISYSWGGESEKIVETVCGKFADMELNIIRDKIALGYKGNIKEFMERLGRGKFVIVIISDKYLKSENCMFEMLQLKNRGDFYKRIFPIVLDDAAIYKEQKRLDYIIYWDKEIKKLNKKHKELNDFANTHLAVEKLGQYRDIRRIIDEITDMFRGMNTLTPVMHHNDDFSELINAINNAMKQDGRT